MKLLTQIANVQFKRKTKIESMPFEYVYAREYDDRHLAMKIRYHMKQVMACLLELKFRGVDVCNLLSNELAEYRECAIKHSDNELKMYVKLEGRK